MPQKYNNYMLHVATLVFVDSKEKYCYSLIFSIGHEYTMLLIYFFFTILHL